jgi:multidrug efflux system membrane fusion protein
MLEKIKAIFNDVLRKYLSLNQAKRVVVAIFVIVSLWMFTGIFKMMPQQEEIQSSGQDFNYKVIESTAKEIPFVYGTHAVIEAKETAKLFAEISGQVTGVIAREGAYLKKDDPILQVDNKNTIEELNEAEYDFKTKTVKYQSTQQLYDKGLSSYSALVNAQKELKSAESNLKSAQIKYDNTLIKAPFDGYIDNIRVKVGDHLRGQTDLIAEFINTETMVAVAYIPVKYVDILGDACRGTLKGIEGEVVFVSKIADSSTRTYRLEVELKNHDAVLKVGDTDELVLKTKRRFKSHNIPDYALTMSSSKDIGVKILDEQNIVRYYEVEIIREEEDSVWVAGLPEKARIITLGHTYLSDGMQVK